MNQEEKKITVLGLGGAGCRMIGALNREELGKSLHLLAVDTSRSGVESAGLPPEQTLLAGVQWRGGRGCGGSTIDGQRAIASERNCIEQLLAGTKLLLICAGFGGGTATGGAPVVLSVARKLEIPTVFFVSMPFSFEGSLRISSAEKILQEEITPLADAVLRIPNDLLFSMLPPDTAFETAFTLADEQFSRSLLAFSAVLLQGNLISTTIEDFVTLLKRRKSDCSIGVGLVHGTAPERGEKALEQLKNSPLLGGSTKFKEADAVVLSIVAGPDLSIGEARDILQKLSGEVLPTCRVVIGAATDETWGDALLVCAVTVKFEEQLIEAAAARTAKAARSPRKSGRTRKAPSDVLQSEFDFDQDNKGTMEQTPEVFFDGEDLDIPTFKRRKLPIDREERL